MAIVSGPNGVLDEECYVGLAIKCVTEGQNHCGLIYRLDGGELRLLHLAFHHDLRDHPYHSNYWTTPTGLEPENQMFLAAYACTVANSAPLLPYGFDASGIVFDQSSGELLEAPAGKGLTCASFLLALFKTVGFPILDETSWEERDQDTQWQQDILKYMEAEGASQEHLDAIVANQFSVRFRPEEVVGASSTPSDEWAIDYSRAMTLAQEVLQDLAA